MAKKQRKEVPDAGVEPLGSNPKTWHTHRRLLVAASLCILVATIYLQCAGHDLINLDGDMYVGENMAIRNGVTLAMIKWAVTAFYASNWHPVTWISLAVDVQLFGLAAGGHHVVNLIFHAANSVLLFILVRTMTGRLWESAVVAAVFAVHPTHVESVAWVAERKDVPSTVFWRLSTYFYVSYSRGGGRLSYIISLVLFAVGLAAKPMLVTLPITFLLIDMWPLGRLDSFKMATVVSLIKEKLPYFALSTASAVITVLAQTAGGAVQSTQTIPLGDRFLNAAVSYAKYTAMLVYPADLGLWYPFEANFGALTIISSCLLLIAITSYAVWRYSEQRYLIVGWLWFLGTLVPVIGIVQVGRQALADRYTYVPFIGISIAVVWLVADTIKRLRLPLVVVALGCSILILVSTVISVRQAAFWKNAETIALRTLAVTKYNYLIESNYCNFLVRQNRLDEAAAQCTNAIAHEPTLVEAYSNLGTVRLKQNKFDEARAYFQKAISLDHNYAMCYGNLAIVESNSENPERAVEYLDRAIDLDKGGFFDAKRRTEAYSAIALAAMKQKSYDTADEGFKQALTAAPDNPDLKRNLALGYRMSSRPGEAIRLLEDVIRKNPGSPEAYSTLGTIYAEQNRKQETIAQFQRALQINPNFAPAQTNLKKVSE